MPETDPISPLATPLHDSAQGIRTRLTGALTLAASWTEAHPFICLSAIIATWFLSACSYSLSTPLWHDELFTWYISQAPTLHDALAQTRLIDLNPPLSYLLTRLSFHIFRIGTLQTRLPEILGFAGALVGIFLFVRRRLGNSFGLFAAALLLGGKSAELAIQARPYGLMLGLTMLSLAAWQASAAAPPKKKSLLSDALLGLCLTCLLLSHIFGLLAWTVIVLSEAVQTYQRRRLNAYRALALILPLAVTLLYIPMLRNHGASLYPQFLQPSPNDIFEFYIGHIDRELVTLWLSALVLVTVAGRSWLRAGRTLFLTVPEWVATAGLISLPLIVILRLMLQHAAWFQRYGIAGSLGITILFTVFYCWWTNSRPAAALIGILLALTITGRLPDAISATVDTQIFRHTSTNPATFPVTLLPDANLPIVAASGLTFLEMTQREPAALQDRTFYLTGGDIALQYAHATIFEGMDKEVALFHLQTHTEPYTRFLHDHPHFYVLGTYAYQEDWLLPKLQADGATIRRIGTVNASYRDHELYEIMVTPPQPEP